MFVILPGAVILLVLWAIFQPPDFEHWEACKEMVYSDNPLVYSAGFVMCTFYAAEFIVWYVVVLQGLRVIVAMLPFLFLYFVVKVLVLWH